jgi:hypothetical protein
MMHLLLFCLAVLGVEMVRGEMVRARTYTMYPGKRLLVNGSSIDTNSKSKSAQSILQCGIHCLEEEDCVAANYEDVGICHMTSAGYFSLEDSSNTTAILGPHEGKNDTLNAHDMF